MRPSNPSKSTKVNKSKFSIVVVAPREHHSVVAPFTLSTINVVKAPNFVCDSGI